jgi:hypothetical protein
MSIPPNVQAGTPVPSIQMAFARAGLPQAPTEEAPIAMDGHRTNGFGNLDRTHGHQKE